MFSFGIKSDVDKLAQAVDNLGNKQVPFATSVALNQVALKAKTALLTEIKSVFDAPTPFIQNSLFTKPSNKTNLEVTVGHKQNPGRTSASSTLKAEIQGGARAEKSTEKLVHEFLVPSRALTLNQYGNIPSRVLGAVRDLLASGADSVRVGSKVYVVMPVGNPQGLFPGVYERAQGKTKIRGKAGNKTATTSGGRLRPVVMFVDHARYSQRYDLIGVVEKVYQAEFGKAFASAMDAALANAKVRL